MTSQASFPLSQIPHRARGRIVEILDDHTPAPDSAEYGVTIPLHDRLLDLGFEEGAVVEVRHQGPFGGPLAVQVDDRLIAIRPGDAASVLVHLEPGA